MNNRTAVYRQIRAQRTWRPLGKMSWWRIVAGVTLLLLALLLSGVPAQRLAASGRFEAAERLILSRAWMEKYKPESLRFIRAGVLYEHGEEAAAGELLRNINPSDLSEGEAREYEVLLEALGPGQT
ncbi:MAG: hypothetical protein IJV30_02945 [Oscillospiraceae bacterium]|jgi:hypothetical protein|nr:hypothetical protein [Oscillospiraceae bacterium]